MLKKTGTQYLVPTEYIRKIYNNMKEADKPPLSIMENSLVKRVVCKKNYDDKEWIRIIEGDIEYVGDTQRCTMTYIKSNEDKHEDENKDTLMLKVDNFEDAIHLAEKMGFTYTSYQENMRSKFAYELDDVTYLIRFDIWAQIPKYTVVEIGLFSSGQNDLSRIVKNLELLEYAEKLDQNFAKYTDKEKEEKRIKKNSINIDRLFEILHGKKASQNRYITFNSKVFEFSKTFDT